MTQSLVLAYTPPVGAVDVRACGAKGDGGLSRTGAVTSGSAILTFSAWESPANPSDTGKNIQIAGAGVGGSVLAATILSYQSATQVTLSVNASTTVSVAANGVGATCAWWSQDDSVAIQAAVTAARDAGGGIVTFPSGVYAAQGIIIENDVIFAGQGMGSTTLMLLPGSTSDLLIGRNFATWTGRTALTNKNPEGVGNWGLRDISLDGNKDFCPGGGSCVKVYSYASSMSHVRMHNSATHNLVTEYGASDTPLQQRYGGVQTQWNDVRLGYAAGKGWQHGGPHDMTVSDMQIYFNAQHGLHQTQTARVQSGGGLGFKGGHIWGNGGAFGSGFNNVCIEDGGTNDFTGTQIEGCSNANIKILRSCTITGCKIYPAGNTTGTGLQIGDATHGPQGVLVLGAWFNSFGPGTAAAIDLTFDGGGSYVDALVTATGGTMIVGYTETTQQKTSRYQIMVTGGATGSLYVWPDPALGGQFKLRGGQGVELGTAIGGPLMGRSGNGSPEGVVAGPVSSTYHRLDGTAGACFYVKESGGNGSTGWVAK